MNNQFEIVKERIAAIDVVSKYLGEPAKVSGNNYFWHSFLRSGDNDPSLCVNIEKNVITDFGNDTFKGQDIFNFVVKYYEVMEHKQITNLEALKIIVDEFNLDIDLNKSSYTSTYDKNENIKVSNRTHILKATNATVDEVFTMLDTVSFKLKPNSNEIGEIKNRIPKLKRKYYSLHEIKSAIANGCTIIPAGIKSEKDWLDELHHYQMFMIDVDNTAKINGVKVSYTIEDKEHITVNRMLEYCKSINLLPTFVYYTFTNSAKQQRFRLVYILDKTIDYKKEVQEIYHFLVETFKDFNIDTAPTSIASLFLGGTEIVYSSDIVYSVIEVEQSLENVFEQDLKTINQMLSGNPYCVMPGKLCYVIYTKETKKYIPISNYVVWSSEKINYKNGNTVDVKYKINTLVLDNPNLKLQELVIDKDSYAKFDFNLGSAWDKYCIISAGRSNTDKLREVCQILSKNTMKEKNIFAHSGFVRIHNNLIYLYHNGFIGNTENIEVDLSGDKLERYCFTDKEFFIYDALKRSLSFLEVADSNVTIPIIATTYLAPLYSIFARNGIKADFILMLIGKSGTRKSSLTALSLCHFGKFDRDNFPTTFRDTFNSIEKKAFVLKDTLNVIDDYNPETLGNKKLDTLEKASAMYGDRSGRTRMSQDGQTLKAPYTARGLCIVTGEMKPDFAQSRVARMLFVDMKQNSVNLANLTELQENSEQLAFSMKIFIKWIIQNEEAIIDYAKLEMKELNKNTYSTAHGRTSETVNILKIGFKLFTKFMIEHNVIDGKQKQFWEIKANEVFKVLVEAQTQDINELKPTDLFYNALEQLFETHEICVKDMISGAMIEAWGHSKHVGYYNSNENYYYFHPDIIYTEICGFYARQNSKFPINQQALWKYLAEDGYLYRPEKGRNKIAKTIDGSSMYLVKIKKRVIDVQDQEIITGQKVREGSIYQKRIQPTF